MKEFDFNEFLQQLLSHSSLEKCCTEESYKKGTHIFNQGEVCKDVFCMRGGLVKLYFNTLEGKEWIKSFIADQGLFGSRSSQLRGLPSPFSALCLEDTEIIRFPYDIFEQVCSEDMALARTALRFMQWLGMKKEIREYQLLCLSAEEACGEFMRSNPQLLDRLTQIDIARYLGITPIAFSRIKKRLVAYDSKSPTI